MYEPETEADKKLSIEAKDKQKLAKVMILITKLEVEVSKETKMRGEARAAMEAAGSAVADAHAAALTAKRATTLAVFEGRKKAAAEAKQVWLTLARNTSVAYLV